MKVASLSCRCVLSVLVLLSVSAPVRASFHLMRISEVMLSYRGDSRIQFFELQMTSCCQNFVRTHTLCFFDARNNLVSEFVIPDNVANGDNGAFILFGTQAFADAVEGDLEPDFILPANFLTEAMVHGGRFSFEGPSLGAAVDSLAYGNYSGDNTGYGSPAPAVSVTTTMSLTRTRTASPRDNSTDFTFQTPSPTNNAGELLTLSIPATPCFLEDDFDDLASWDEPDPNAGLDLTSCGIPAAADIGAVELGASRMLLRPGLEDQLSLGAPIAFTGLTSAAAASFAMEPSYRVRFDIVAQPGILGGAFFVGQHYSFDDVSMTLDVGEGAGMGFTVSFDCPHQFDGDCDHVHPDQRGACVQPNDQFDGPSSVTFPGGLLTASGEPYSIVMDVDGDDVEGPFSMRLKLYPAGEAEPSSYLGSWTVPFGLGVTPDEELDHGVLLVALGDNAAALEVTDFSVCAVPRHQQFVLDLQCDLTPAGTLFLTWRNPAGADLEHPIAILVNGEEVERLPGDSVSHKLFGLPDEDFDVDIINYSGVAASCSVCVNDPPNAVIDGPAKALREGDTVTIQLDSSASDDGDNGAQELTRQWVTAASPPGSIVEISDPFAAVIDVTMDFDGEYSFELTVTDAGCAGDFSDSLAALAVHDVFVTHVEKSLQRPADCDQNGAIQLTDGVCILGHLFRGEPRVLPCGDGSRLHASNLALLDMDGNGNLDLTDAVLVFRYLFASGQPPPLCPDAVCSRCVLIAGCPDNLALCP